MASKVCPECGHEFKGKGWEGIDAHWQAKHEDVLSFEDAGPLQKRWHDKWEEVMADKAMYWTANAGEPVPCQKCGQHMRKPEIPKSRSKNLRFIDKGLAVSNA